MSWPRSALPLALLTIALLVSACATTASKKAPTATPMLTPPALSIEPARPLVWIAHQLPFAVPLGKIYNTGLFFSQADGATAYACIESDQSVRVWVTRDKAVHWTHGVDVPGAADSCHITVDDARPETAILLTYHAIDDHCNACYHGDYRNYLTRDAGATWTPLAAPAPDTPLFGTLTSQGDVTFATASTTPHSACFDCYTALYVSKDDMRTWSRIDAGIQAAGRFAYCYWLNDAGEILAETMNRFARQDELWLTSDQGAHWKAWSVTHADSFIVSEGQSQRFWRACGVISGTSSNDPPNLPHLICATDGGVTWLAMGGASSSSMDVFAQANDGAVLVANSSPYHGEVAMTLLRAAPGQADWESLGALPVSGTPQAVADTLWLLKRSANYGDALTTIHIATYP